MSLALPTFASGAVINASTLMDLCASVRIYLNEGIVSGDRVSSWMVSNHVYRPDFYSGSNPHTTLTSGETYFRQRGQSVERQSFWNYHLGTDTGNGYFPIPGLCGTIQIPENISTNGYRTRIFASFYGYEFGGDLGPIDETSPNGAMVLDLLVDGTPVGFDQTIYKGSQANNATIVAPHRIVGLYARKQIPFIYSAALNKGVHNIAVGLIPKTVSASEEKSIALSYKEILS